MSAIPKARRSNIVNVTVSPNQWDSYPEISRSNISNCTFKNLNSSTLIDRSELLDSKIQPSSSSAAAVETTNKDEREAVIQRSKVHGSQIYSSQVHRSDVKQSIITDAEVHKSMLENCSVAPKIHLVRTTARSTKFVSAKLVNCSQLNHSVVLGESTLEKSMIKGSVIADKTTCDRAQLDGSVVARSRIDRSTVTDCDVMDCVIQKTTFKGMVLRYGIWQNGDLIGRTSEEHEVIVQAREKPLQMTGNPSTTSPLPPLPPSGTSTALQTMPTVPDEQTPGPGWKAAEAVCFSFFSCCIVPFLLL